MSLDLDCIIKECQDPALGLVCVNNIESTITLMMLPACQAHADQMKSKPFTIMLDMDKGPSVELGEKSDDFRPDLILTFEVVG